MKYCEGDSLAVYYSTYFRFFQSPLHTSAYLATCSLLVASQASRDCHFENVVLFLTLFVGTSICGSTGLVSVIFQYRDILCSSNDIEVTELLRCYPVLLGWDSSVGIATRYGFDGPRIVSRWGEIFPYLSRPDLGQIEVTAHRIPLFHRGTATGVWPSPTPTPH